MRLLLLPFLLLAAFFSPAQPAEPSRASAWQFEGYRAALGGLLQEERCRVLSSDARRELAWHVQRIEEGLRREWGAATLEAEAAAVAAAPAKECGEVTAAEAEQVLAAARDFNGLVRGGEFSPEILRVADGARLARLLLAQRVDDRCQAIGHERRQDFDADVEKLRARLAAETDPESLAPLDAFADRLAAELHDGEPAISCEEFAGPGLERMLGEAHRAAAW